MTSDLPTSTLEAIVSVNRFFQKSALSEGTLGAAAMSAAYMDDALDEILARTSGPSQRQGTRGGNMSRFTIWQCADFCCEHKSYSEKSWNVGIAPGDYQSVSSWRQALYLAAGYIKSSSLTDALGVADELERDGTVRAYVRAWRLRHALKLAGAE